MRYFGWLLFIKPVFNIFLISQTFSWLLGSIFDIFFIKGASGSAGSKTEICLIFVIFILSGRFSLYVTGSRTFKILKNSNLAKFSLLLDFVVWINVVFMFGVFYRRYILSLFLRVSSLTLLLLVNFLIILLKNTKFCLSSSYNL